MSWTIIVCVRVKNQAFTWEYPSSNLSIAIYLCHWYEDQMRLKKKKKSPGPTALMIYKCNNGSCYQSSVYSFQGTNGNLNYR